MTLPIQTLRPRQFLLFAAALLVCVNAGGVLLYVLTTPDIGLRCAFRRVIIGINEDSVQPQRGQTRPERGDEIVQVGDHRTPTWVHFLRALLEEDRRRSAGEQTANRTQLNGEDVLLVRFTKPGSPETEHDCWCRFDTPPLRELAPSVLWLALKLCLFLVGAVVFWKRPEDRSAALFFWFCILSVGAYMGGYHWARILTHPALLLGFMVSAVLLPVVTLHFFLVFPRPKQFLIRRPGWTLTAVYGPPLVFLAAMIWNYGRVRGLWQPGSQDEDINRTIEVSLLEFRSVIHMYLAVAACWYVTGVVALLHAYRTASDATERNQVKWILLGAAVALAPIGYTLYLAAFKPQLFGSGGATWPMFAASAFVTAAFAVSITRYRLMQLDQILSSGLVYFLISTVAGLLYYALLLLGMIVVGSQVMDGPSLEHAVWAGVTALVFLVVLDVVRGRVMRALDRRLHRERYQLDKTLRRMGEAVEQLVDPPTLARRLLQASADLLGVTRGAVYLREGEPPCYRLAGSLGPTPALVELPPGCPLIEKLESSGALIAPARPGPVDSSAQRQLRFLGGEVARVLSHEGRLLAFLILGPKEPGAYTAEDLNLLGEFAQLTALALESAQRRQTIEALGGELRDKVEKIAEQQRRILALQSQLQAGVRGQQPGGTQAREVAASPHPDLGFLTPGQGGIVGSSLAMRHLLDLVRKVAASESAVLLRGESGTGKELLARALHEQSPRAGKAFVKVHCAALSPGLLESELFGHVKGAFTGAHRDKLGRFELADGGTLFLDEIGDISLDVQTKLLRVLQEMTFERVGSSEPIAVNVRVVAATHQNLEELIRQGRFREDLYYRLNVISLVVPPLRDRREDIPELALHFLRQYALKSGKKVDQIDDEAMVVLKSHAWPGNIRELENVIERAVVVADGPTVTLFELPPDLVEASEVWMSETEVPRDGASAFEIGPRGLQAERTERDRLERERLVRALTAARGNKAEAARALGLARSTLVSRLKKHGLN